MIPLNGQDNSPNVRSGGGAIPPPVTVEQVHQITERVGRKETMYNQEIKERFISQFAKSADGAERNVRLYKKLGAYERRWSADLCTRSAEEIESALTEALGVIRKDNTRFARASVYAYLKWCKDNDIEGAIDPVKIKISTEDNVRVRMITGPLQLQRYLDQVFKPEDMQTVDNAYRCYCWLAFGGVPDNEVFNVTIDEVDFTRMVVRHNGEEFPIYREAVPAFKNCVTCTEFYAECNRVYTNTMRVRRRPDIKTLIRTTGKTANRTTIISQFQKRVKYAMDTGQTTLNLSYSRIWLSGIFYRVYEAERAGIEPDFIEIADWMIKANGASDVESKTWSEHRTYLRTIKYGLQKDYAEWKKLFNT